MAITSKDSLNDNIHFDNTTDRTSLWAGTKKSILTSVEAYTA